MISAETDPSASAFSRVIKGLIRPLVRVLIARRIGAPAFYRLVKQVYVEVAEREFRLGGDAPTDSRISLLTGVHRRDVHRLRGNGEDGDAVTRQKVSALATVLGRWLADPETSDANGQPLPLPRTAPEGPSFERLARSVSSDIRPRTMLDELSRQGLVAEDETTGEITMVTGAFLGPADQDQKIHFFAGNVGDHIAAAVDNLLADDPPFMERAVFYNRLSSRSADEIEALARRLGAEALATVNRLAHQRQTEDLDAPGDTERIRFGVFFYRTEASSTDERPTPAERSEE